jgi:hypothetical protein
MAFDDDVLSPDPDSGLEPRGGFGLRLFKSNTDAMREDVLPRAKPASEQTLADALFAGGMPAQTGSAFPAASSSSSAPAQGGSLADALGLGGGAPVESVEAPASNQGNFSRGWDVSGKQLKQTAYGTAALIGDTIGASGVKEWGLKGFKDAEKEVQAISKDSDSFTNAMEKGEMGKWFTYSSGYLLGQVAELGVASLAGAAVGSAAAPGVGTATGAVAGAIEKGAVQSGVKAMVAKMIDKEAASLVAKGMAADVAATTATTSVYRTIGATTANTFLNATQELGSIYGDAVEEAAKSGQEYSLGKVWLSGMMATAVDSWADSKAVGKMMDAVKGGKGIGGVAVEAFKGGFREGMTEGVQTAIERWGADKDLASQEAFKEYIDSAAVGVLGGSISGGSAAGVKRMLEPSDDKATPPPGKTVDDGQTSLAPSNQGRGVNDELDLTMPMAQFRESLSNVGYVASIYQDADQRQKQLIDMAVDRAGLRREFDQAFKDGEAMSRGAELLTSDPQERDLFLDALGKYATTMPRGGVFKSMPVKAVTEDEANAQFTQANEQLYGPAVTRNTATDAAPAAEPEPIEDTTPKGIVSSMAVSLPQDYTQGSVDKYGITSYVEPYSQSADIHQRVYSHAALPDMFFRSTKDVFEALKIRKQAKADGTWDIAPQSQEESQDFGGDQTLEDADKEVVVSRLDMRSQAKGNGEIKPEDVEMVALPEGIQRIADLFGVRAIGFRSDKTGIRGFAGPSNQIYLNVAHADKIDPRMVLGHEIWHQLERRDPEMATELSDEVVKYIKGEAFEKYASDLEQIGYSKDKINSEATADILGILFTDKAFWEQLGQKNPTLIQRVLGLINQILDSIKTAAKAERRGLNAEAITDLNQVRDMLTDVVAKLAQPIQVGDNTNIDLMEEDDAVAAVKAMIKQGNVAGAAKMFKEEDLYNRSNKTVSFSELLKQKPEPASFPVKGSQPKQSAGAGAGRGKDADRTIDNADEGKAADFGVDQGEVDYGVYQGKKPAAKTAKKAAAKPSTEKILKAPAEMGLPQSFDENNQRLAPVEGPGGTLIDRELEAPDLFQAPDKGKQLSLGIGRVMPKQYNAFKARIDSILRLTGQAQFYRDTLARLYQGVAEIDASLAAGRSFVENGVRYQAVDQSDENAYLWGESGFRDAKNLPQDKLLAIRRDLMDEIANVQTQSVRGMASLFKRSLKRIDYELSIARAQAIKNGTSRDIVDAIYEPARKSLFAMQTVDRGETQNNVSDEAQTAMDEAFQSDMFEGQKAAMGLLADYKAGKVTEMQLKELQREGLREGDFTHVELVASYRAFGMDISHDIMNVDSQLAVRKKLSDHMRETNYHTNARNEWIVSMHKVVSRFPGMLTGNLFNDGERRVYQEWVSPRKEIAKRLNVTEEMASADNPSQAFKNLLFIKYDLSEMRNPSYIEDPVMREALVSTIHDLPQAWMQDLAYALRRRPSLANAIFDETNGVVSLSEKAEFDNWIEQQKKARDKDAEIAAKVPYFTELRNLDGMNPELDSRPGVVGEDGVAPTEYEKLWVKIANTEASQLETIGDMVNQLTAYRQGGFNLDSGNPVASADADQMAAEYIDSIFTNEMMSVPVDAFGNEMTQYGARYTPDIGFGMTVEQAGERDLGTPSLEQNIGEESTQDLLESGVIDENGEIADVGESAEEALISTKREERKNIPTSLEGPAQYEFMDDYDMVNGPWKGAPAMASLATQIAEMNSPVPVTLLEHAGQLPETIRSKVMERLGKNLGAKGLYHDGKVYVFGSQILGPNDLQFTVFHEVYGHLGMRAFLGEKFDSFLETAYRTSNEVKVLADTIMQEKGVGRLEAVDEVLAGMAAVATPASTFNQWLGKVIESLRAAGFNSVADWFAKTSGAEIAFTLQQAKDNMRSGQVNLSGSPEEFRLAEQILPYEMFAKSGDKTRAYVRYNPVTDTWAVFIANGSDIRDKAGYTPMVFDTYEEAYEAIKAKGKVERRTRSGMYIDDKIPPDLIAIPRFQDVSGWAKLKRSFITRVQNEYHPVFQVVEHLRKMGRISENIDVKQALMLYERRTGAAVEYFRQHHVEPLLAMVKRAGELGADIDTINRYIAARHAKERNETVARVNPDMKDGGSGLTTKDAADFIKEVEGSAYAKVLEDIGKRLDTISREKLQYMLAHGMITKKAFEKMSAYKHYVNLSGVVGVDEEYDDPGMLAGGNKFNAQKGAEKRAFGRGAGNEAPDVLARTILSAEAQIIRANKNMVAQRILGMLETNYDPNFASVNKQAMKRQVNAVTGQVEFVPDTNYMAQKNVMVAKVRGIPVTIEFADNSAGSFADAIHGMVMPPQSTPIMSKLGEVNQFMGQMLTTWNPAWIAINFVRDVQTMYFNAATDGRITKDQARAMLKMMPKAIATALHMFNPRLPFKPDPDMLQALNEMKVEGGLTSFVNRHGLEDQVDQINAALYGKSRMQKIQGLFQFMEYLTIPMEVAPRLAAYKVVRDGGFTRAESAVFSGEITVNFNMRGSMKELRQLYLFFNPAVQGTAKIFDLAKNNPKRMANYAIAFAAVGAIANLIGRAASGDDEDDINRMDKLPIYKRATSIVLWADGPAIPIPYGWNAFYAAGHFAMDSLLGIQPLSVSAKRVAVSAFEAFSPLGTAGLDSKDAVTAVAKGVSPTAMLPVIEYMANENRYGGPIRMEQSPFEQAKKPDSQMAFRSVSPISKAVTGTLNEMTGGNRYKSGAIDVNPATIDFMIQSYLPGFANEAYKGAGTAIRVARGEKVNEAPLPLIGRFEARVPEGWDAGGFRRVSELVETTYKEYKMMPESRDQIREDYPSIGTAHAMISATNQQIREIRKAMDNVERSQGFSDAEKVERTNFLREREKATYQRAVKRLSSLGGKYKDSLIEAQ